MPNWCNNIQWIQPFIAWPNTGLYWIGCWNFPTCQYSTQACIWTTSVSVEVAIEAASQMSYASECLNWTIPHMCTASWSIGQLLVITLKQIAALEQTAFLPELGLISVVHWIYMWRWLAACTCIHWSTVSQTLVWFQQNDREATVYRVVICIWLITGKVTPNQTTALILSSRGEGGVSVLLTGNQWLPP